MDYDLEESYIATIRDELPTLSEPEQIRKLCIEDECAMPDSIIALSVARRTANRVVIKWTEEGEDAEIERYQFSISPFNHDDDSDNDYWQWGGEVTADYYRYDGGILGDETEAVKERGTVDGWMFEGEIEVFVGVLNWDSGERERIVLKLIEE